MRLYDALHKTDALDQAAPSEDVARLLARNFFEGLDDDDLNYRGPLTHCGPGRGAGLQVQENWIKLSAKLKLKFFMGCTGRFAVDRVTSLPGK